MLIELRSTGCQTLTPPSKHPSGERARWERAREPGRVDGHTLRRACARVAAAALLARHWPAVGTRDEAALALAGFLLRGGMPVEEADHVARTVAKAAEDEEWAKRGKAIQMVRAQVEGRPVAGGTKLAALLHGDGTRVVAQARAWLGLRDGRDGRDGGEGGESARRQSRSLEGTHSPEMTAFDGDDRPRVIPLWLVKEALLRWLWPGRIPLGTITLLDGDPGLGKSLVTLDLVARVTQNGAMPDGSAGIAGGAVLLSAEDDLAATVRPRLRAAGADVQRVVAVQTVLASDEETGREQERAFTLPGDIPLLEQAIREVDARLIVIDPLMAYLDGKVNSWRDQDVRAALTPLSRLAERTGVAVVILRHLTKGGGGNAIYRGGGSIGIIGAARSGLLVAKAPDDPEHERVLSGSKSNLGPPMPSLRYRISAGGEDETPRVEWLGACDYTAASLLSEATGDHELPARDEARALLTDVLADGPVPQRDVERAARAAGISLTTLSRAKKRLGVEAKKVGFHGASRWVWQLPADDRDAPAHAKAVISPEGSHAPDVTAFSEDDLLRAERAEMDAGDATNTAHDGEGAPA